VTQAAVLLVVGRVQHGQKRLAVALRLAVRLCLLHLQLYLRRTLLQSARTSNDAYQACSILPRRRRRPHLLPGDSAVLCAAALAALQKLRATAILSIAKCASETSLFNHKAAKNCLS